jgi:hypothetical protein
MDYKFKTLKNNVLVDSNKLLLGSGTIVKINNKKYVVSAAHNIFYKK